MCASKVIRKDRAVYERDHIATKPAVQAPQPFLAGRPLADALWALLCDKPRGSAAMGSHERHTLRVSRKLSP